MASRRLYAKLCGLGLGTAGVVAVVGVSYTKRKHEGTVFASWTTNFEPSVKWDFNWDRREPKSLMKPSKSILTSGQSQDSPSKDDKDYNNKLKKVDVTPTATRHLLLIRHGQYNIEYKADEKRILTPLGREQADLTGLRLKELDLSPTLLICSTLTRARETADIIHKHFPGLPREQTDLLREGAPIPPEPPIGHSDHYRPEKRHFYVDGARIEAAFRKYFHRADSGQTADSHEIVICHGNVIRYFVCRALQLPPEAWLRISLYHASITWVTICPTGRVSIRAIGNSGHMPLSKLTMY